MKKALMFFLVTIHIFGVEAYFGASFNKLERWDTKDNPPKEYILSDKINFGIYGEVIHQVSQVKLGLGSSFEKGYEFQNSSFDAIPIYGLIRWTFNDWNSYWAWKQGFVLYENTDLNTSNGEYWELATGREIGEKLHLEGGFSLVTGKLNNVKMWDTKITLRLGMKLF